MRPGQVLVQTFQPDARPIAHAARHDVERFLTEELERRRELGYPPFKHLVRIVVSGPALEQVLRALEELKAGIPRGGAARPGAPAAAAQPPPGTARGEDRVASRARVAGGAAAAGRGAGHAQGGAVRRRRRRPAERVTEAPGHEVHWAAVHDHDEHDHPHPHGEVLDDPLGEGVDDDELDAETEAQAAARARADPPVRRQRAAPQGPRGLGLRRRPAAADRPDGRPDAGRPRGRSRRDAGGRAPAGVRVPAESRAGPGRGDQSPDRRARGGDVGGRGGLPVSARGARPGRARDDGDDRGAATPPGRP